MEQKEPAAAIPNLPNDISSNPEESSEYYDIYDEIDSGEKAMIISKVIGQQILGSLRYDIQHD